MIIIIIVIKYKVSLEIKINKMNATGHHFRSKCRTSNKGPSEKRIQ